MKDQMRVTNIDRFSELVYSEMVGAMLPFFLESLIVSRLDLQDMINSRCFPHDKGKIIAFIYWWHLWGKSQYTGVVWAWEKDFLGLLLSPANAIPQSAIKIITNAMLAVWEAREDLRAAFDLKTDCGRIGFVDWVENSGRREDVFLKYIDKLPVDDTHSAHGGAHPAHDFGNYRTNGINIVGYARGELGIGEDVRMSAFSCLAERIPFSVYDVLFPLETRSSSTEFDKYIQADPQYHANLICMPCTETCQLLLKLGSGFFNNRYNIGAWQWELPCWPKEYQLLYKLIDEVWAFSRYTEKMFKESSPVSVHYMPMAVDYPLSTTAKRSQFGLHEDRFLFFLMFDGNSWLTRKNPLSAVRSFEKAFPKSNQKVGLFIKAMNIREDHPDWVAIRKIASNDSRITIVIAHLSRSEVLGLINMCDCFVSLHRAEGFGRIIAEAMLFKKPVIVTNFSGNCDFTNKENSLLVNGNLVPLKKGDYPAWEGQYWCDPDVDEGAKQMQVCYEDAALRDRIAEAGQLHIKRYHSAKVIGQAYKERLRCLGLLD